MPDTDRLLDAILNHVAFDGWSHAALEAGAREVGADDAALEAAFPRGPVDAALAYHRRGDAEMVAKLAEAGLDDMRYRDRVAAGVRLRLEGADRELVRRGVTLFALPVNAATGASALWGTADAIWTALGDTSRDVNWYTKRATLSGVISATLLYWLGDDSEGSADSWAFLDRRIDDVMRFEGAKAKIRGSALGKALATGPGRVLDFVRAPGARPGYPGSWSGK